MKWSRRDLSFLLPALAIAQTPSRKEALPSNAFRFEDLPTRQSGAILSRQILQGDTHSGYLIDLHESELPAGEAPHAPHHHVHEEILLIREGLLDVTILGKTTRLGPGSVAYLASNQEHGWRNAGTTTAKYFVLALGDDKE
jgi:mannose-6-phosphate isomerase-like protein (cupin superfamily)